jgi:alkaline phosphatase D
MNPRLNRRAASIALGTLFGGVGVLSVLRPQAHARQATAGGADPFCLGVASGMPRPDSVVLWTRLAPRPHEPGGGLPDAALPVRWELAEDERFSRGLRTGTFVALPEHAHCVHVEVAGLPSDSRYFYRFMVGDAVSPVGRTRTAPAPEADVAGLRIALASCQHFEQGAFAAHREIAARDLDFVLFVGDYIYESTNPRFRIRSHEASPPQTLDGYRARHATYKLDADLRAAHAAHPWVLTWDDHEVENDYAGDASRSEADAGAFLRRRAAAYKAYFEHLPVSPAMAPHGAAMRIHERFSWGRLAELWTLDARQYRSVQACGEPGRAGGRLVSGSCDGIDGGLRTVLGTAQEAWVANGLAHSERRWKILAQGSQLSPGGVDTPVGRRIFSDGWDGYPAARDRLLQAMSQARSGGVLHLGGDVHRHVAAALRLRPNDERSRIVGSEFVCSSITTRGVAEAATSFVRSSNPDILHGRSDERGYALIEITRAQAACDFRATAFPVTEAAVLHTQARCVAVAGQGPELV